MPYAAKAKISYSYVIDRLELYVTFGLPMQRTFKLLPDPTEYPLLPPVNKWLMKIGTVDYDIITDAWLDDYTMLLTSDDCPPPAAAVSLAYLGPDSGLKTTWGKQWEPWGKIIASAVGSTLFQSGMILLWSGSIVTIPQGWHLCDGTEGTPNLRDRFVVGAGNTYTPGLTGGTLQHNHFCNMSTGENSSYYTVNSGDEQDIATDPHTHDISAPTENAGTLPPYYALAYIMKL